MIKVLIGGSPCTHWSIAQHNGREKEASGMGWELFKCYLAAKEKFKPDYFLYENNKSASEAIKEQISHELGAPLHYINSALVSAQNRQRFYVHNFGDIGQPEDRGIVLDDILDSSDGEQFYQLAHVSKGASYCVACRGRYKDDGTIGQHLEPRTDGKTNTLTTVQKDNYVAQPIRLGDIATSAQAHRVYSPYGKSVNITANGGGQGGKTGLYMCPIDLAEYTLEKDKYHVVENGKIETRYGVQDIDLPDGAYVIRKLKPVECERLQTLPDGYTEGIPDSQRYKCLGNGWTAEVIKFILSHIDAPKDEPIVVLSMFDGIATGRYVFESLGFTNVTYYAYEIDEPAMFIANKNYPDIIQLGNAFDLHRDDWELGKRYDDEPPTTHEDPTLDPQEDQEEEDEDLDSEAGADPSKTTGAAGETAPPDREESLRGSEDPGGVQDLAGSEEADTSERQYIEPQKGKNPIDILLDIAGEALDEFFKQNIIRKFIRVVEGAGLTPEPELLERLQKATLKEISEIAVGFPAYIIAATLEKGSNENKNT